MSFMPTSPASTSICCQGLNGKRTTTKPCIPKIWCTLYGTKYIWLYWVVKMYFLTLFSSIQSTSFINLHNTHIILDHLSLMFLKVYLSCRSHEEGYKTWFLLVVRSGCSWKYCWALNQIWFRFNFPLPEAAAFSQHGRLLPGRTAPSVQEMQVLSYSSQGSVFQLPYIQWKVCQFRSGGRISNKRHRWWIRSSCVWNSKSSNGEVEAQA